MPIKFLKKLCKERAPPAADPVTTRSTAAGDQPATLPMSTSTEKFSDLVKMTIPNDAYRLMATARERRAISHKITCGPDPMIATKPADTPPLPPAKVDDRLWGHYQRTLKLVVIALEKPIEKHEFVSEADEYISTPLQIELEYEFIIQFWDKAVVLLYSKFDPDLSMFVLMAKTYEEGGNFTERMYKIREEVIFKAPVTLRDVNELHNALKGLVSRDGGKPVLLDFLRYLAIKRRKVFANPPCPSEVRCLFMELRYAIQHGTDTEKEMLDTIQDLAAELSKLSEAERALFKVERERVMPYNDA